MNPKAIGNALVLGVVFAATANLTVWAKDEMQPVTSFAGLINDKSVRKLVKPVEKENFALSILGDAKAFRAFLDAAGLKNSPFGVDWDKQAVVVVVLKEHTNRLDFKQWKVTKALTDNIGELVVHLDYIEPFWADRFPALMFRFDKKGLKKVVVKYDDYQGFGKHQGEKTIGEIPCPF